MTARLYPITITRMKLTATVHGRVQNVGYRMFARDAARRLNLGGHVRNLPDGSVYVTATGEEAALRELVRHLERGPHAARVETVECEWSPDATEHSPRPFEVLS